MSKSMMTFEEYCDVNYSLNIPREAQFIIYQDYVAAYERANPVTPEPTPALRGVSPAWDRLYYLGVSITVTSDLGLV